MLEYADLHLKKLLSMPEVFWMCLIQYSIRSLYNLPSSYRDRHSEHCQTFKMEPFAKRIMPECRCATSSFSGQEEGFLELGHFNKHFVKNTINTISAFLSKIGTFFSLVARLWVWLNMHQYPWICLNIPEKGWTNCSDYARALNMHAHLICLAGYWRCLQF